MPRLALAVVLALSVSPLAALAQTGGAAAAPAAATGPAAAPAPAAAKKAPPGAEVAAPKPPPGFQAVSGAAATQPQIRATPLVVIAYLFIWAMTVLYVIYLRSRQKKVEDEIASLTRRLEKAASE